MPPLCICGKILNSGNATLKAYQQHQQEDYIKYDQMHDKQTLTLFSPTRWLQYATMLIQVYQQHIKQSKTRKGLEAKLQSKIKNQQPQIHQFRKIRIKTIYYGVGW